MTPLAHKVMRQEIEGRRGFFPAEISVSDFASVRCFDCCAVSGMAYELADDMAYRGMITKQVAFLPAPLTWIEYVMPDGMKAGFMLQASESSSLAVVFQVVDLRGDLSWVTPETRSIISQAKATALVETANVIPIGRIHLGDLAAAEGLELPEAGPEFAKHLEHLDLNKGHVFLIYALLAIINTPRLIGQTHCQPHTGLGRQLRQSGVTKPLLKWTKVELCVLGFPDSARDGVSGSLTGQRALHFVRSFIRIRLGKLELVRAHMRGNEELGERKPSYVVTKAEAAEAAKRRVARRNALDKLVAEAQAMGEYE